MGKRMNIALFVALLENEFSHAVCEGAFLGAKELDANLYIMPAGIKDAVYDDFDSNCYRYQYNTLYACAGSDSFDAIIIEYGTVTSFLNDEQKIDFLKSLNTDTPIILIAGEEEGCSSVSVNNRAGLEQAILHLIDKHECKNIGFLSGPVDTNQDAKERLDVYKKTMEAKGLYPGDDWIAYGNFSEFCEKEVNELIERHPDIEAIVCANDQMAIGVYNVLEKRGLKPGKDVLVTGFDNSPVAWLLEPHLTTVKADTKELAYRAVMECAKVVKEKKTVHEFVDSQLIVSNSCGCGDIASVDEDGASLYKAISDEGVQAVADRIFDKYFSFFFESERTLQMKGIVEGFFAYFFGLVDEKGVLSIDSEQFYTWYEEFSKTYTEGYVALNHFLSLIFIMRDCLEKKIDSETDKILIYRIMTTANQRLMSSIMKKKLVADEQSKIFEIVLTNITRDMMQFSRDEKRKFKTVLDKFRRMGALSGYVFTYEEAVKHTYNDRWIQPERLFAKAYYKDENSYLYEGTECPVSFKEVFSDRFLPTDHRYDMLVTPLFSGEEQYGLMLLEGDLDKVRYASQLACQISVSIEVLDIIKKQNAIKQELEKNLAQTVANNKILDEMSRQDPLTGISNRRGFLDRVKTIMESEVYKGRKAIALYADMDNLKLVNDEFGHDEGDYSLKTIARALDESFRQSDVIARMGGDEFAAFALSADENFSFTIKDRIKKALERMNNSSDKPYLVNMSIGTYEFVIGEETNIDQILNKADAQLYHEKKNKNKVIYKSIGK